MEPPVPDRPLKVRIDRFLDRLAGYPPKYVFLAIAGFEIAIVVTILALWLVPQRARFAIDARTEIAELIIPGGTVAPEWGDLPVDVPGPDVALDPDETVLRKCRNPKLQFARAFTGPVRVIVTSGQRAMLLHIDGNRHSPGQLACDGGGSLDSPSRVDVSLPVTDGRTMSLRFAGQLVVGDEVRPGERAPRLLRSGSVTTEAESWPFDSGKVSSRTDLALGDTIKTIADGHDTPATIFGLIRLDDDPQTKDDVLHVVGYADAKDVLVLRPGQGGSIPLAIAPTFIARVQAQAEWGILLLVLTLVLNLLNALARVADEHSKSMKASSD